jgi:hypothetical protein
MINPRKGIDLMNNTSIIIRILFAVTLFQHLVRRPSWFEKTLRDAREHVEPPRSTFRESRPPRKFPQYMALMTNIIDSEPSNFEEAGNQHVWRDAMVEEHNSNMRNDVWEIVPRLEGKLVATSRCLYKVKHAVDGSVEKYKARFVARGFSQREGVDYKETFAPIAKYSSIRAIISIASRWVGAFIRWM